MPERPELNKDVLRTHQANERTMLAWIRTGIALMAFGFAIARFGVFLRQIAAVGHVNEGVHKGIGSGWVGAVLVALGMVVNLAATLRYRHIRGIIERGEGSAPNPVAVYVLGGAATLLALAMTVLLARALQE